MRKIILSEYVDTHLYHLLSENPTPGKHCPLILELCPNVYAPTGSSGRMEDCTMAKGLAGKDFLYGVLPFVSSDGQRHETSWWGSKEKTISYIKSAVSDLCENHDADPQNIFLCGFSRGGIAVNYIGLADDEIAGLWRGFLSHDHYDGELEWGGHPWGSPLSDYRKRANVRLDRIKGRPVWISRNPDAQRIRRYIKESGIMGDFTIVDIDLPSLYPTVPNPLFPHYHTSNWLLEDNPYSRLAKEWLHSRIKKQP